MWPPPRSRPSPSTSMRASTIGARRLTSSARSISSTGRVLDRAAARAARRWPPARRSRPASLDQPLDRRADRPRSHAMARPPISAASASSTSTRRAGEHELRAALRRAPARSPGPSPPVAPVTSARAPAELHARAKPGASGKTATVAVKPCRNDSPPTGPISPAAKNPAAGAPAAPRRPPRRRGRRAPNMPAPAAVAGEQQRTRGRAPAERGHADAERLAQVAVGAGGVARVQPHDLARVDVGGDRHLPGRGIGADEPAHEEVALHVLGLVARRPRSPSAARPAPERGPSGGSSSIVSRSFSSAGLPASSRITWPSAAVIVSSGPIGAAPWDTHGSSSTPSSRTPTAPSSTTRSPANSAVAPPARPRRSEPAEQRHRRAPPRPRKCRTASVGKVAGSASRIVPAAPSRSGIPVSAPLPSSTSSTAAWNVDALPSPRWRGPDGDRRAVLDLAPRADHAAGAAARPAPRARAPRSTASSTASGAGRCAPEANTTARSQLAPPRPSRAVSAASSAPAR